MFSKALMFSFTNSEKEKFLSITDHGPGPRPWSIVDTCVMINNLEAIEWVYEVGISDSGRLLEIAAWYGHITMIQLLLTLGCKWTGHELPTAVIARQFKLASWLRDSGYPLELSLSLKYELYHPEVIEWLKS